MSNLKKLLESELTKEELKIAPNSFEVIGSREKAVAIVEISPELESKKKIIAQKIMELHKNVKSVLKKNSERKGEFRTREFELVAGDEDTEVLHKEYGYILRINPEIAYFSEREGIERQRIAQQVKENEVVMLMFAGIGSYAIAIVKKQPKIEKIYAIELNPQAVEYIKENAMINRVADKIIPIEGDVRKESENFFGNCNRVIMPLPLHASEFLECAINCLKERGIIHFYTLLEKKDFSEAKRQIDAICNKMHKKYKILNERKVTEYSPKKWKVCIDFEIL